MFRELRQAWPFRRVHVNMLLVLNVLLIEIVQVHFLLTVAGLQELQEIPLKLIAVLVDVLLGILTHLEHSTHMPF